MLLAETFKTSATRSTGCSAAAIIALSWIESLLSFIFSNSSLAFATVSGSIFTFGHAIFPSLKGYSFSKRIEHLY